MPSFCNRSAIITAEQLRWDNWGPVCALVSAPQYGYGINDDLPAIAMWISTLDGAEKVREYDWILRDDRDETGVFSVCTPEVFAHTYAAVLAPTQ